MANYVYITTSLDGYIADKDEKFDWLMNIPNPDNSDFGFADFIAKIDGIIMGREIFERVLTFDQWIYSKKVFILSTTLHEVPEDLIGKQQF